MWPDRQGHQYYSNTLADLGTSELPEQKTHQGPHVQKEASSIKVSALRGSWVYDSSPACTVSPELLRVWGINWLLNPGWINPHIRFLSSEGKAVEVSLFNDWQSHRNLEPDGVGEPIPISHLQMGILRSKISQKASYSQSSTRSTLSHCHIMQEIQEPGRPMARHKALGFFLSISVQHLSLNSKEEFPLGNGGKSLSPSLAAARSFYDLWQSRRRAIIIQYLPIVMLQFQRQSERTQPQSGLLNLSFVRL